MSPSPDLSDGRLRAVLHAIPDYTAYITPDHVYRFTNAAYQHLFGLDPDTISGQHVSSVLGDQGYAFSKPNLDRALAGETVEVESVVLVEGRAPRLAVRYVPDRGPDGDVRGVIVHARDVSEQRRTEEELQRSRRRIDAQVDVLFRYAPVVLFATDAAGTFTHSEGRALAKIGLSDGDLVGANVFEAYASHPDITEPLRRVLSGEDTETTFRDEVDGRCFETHASALPADEDGRPSGLVGVAVDVTEREEALSERKRVAEQLRRRNTELEEFAYVASHDLQEPLRTITSFIQLLQRRHPEHFATGDAAEYMGFISDAATRMRALISDLLAYSRIGRSEERDVRLPLNQVLTDIQTDLAVRILETGAVITVEGELPELDAAPGQLAIVFRNLLSNALKFHRPGQTPHVTVSAQRVEQTHRPTGDPNGPGWRIAVKDDGIGIAPEHLTRIFAVFKRLHARDQYAGTGIGLAACKKVVENRGGRIWAESTPGQGTTLLVDWPERAAP